MNKTLKRNLLLIAVSLCVLPAAAQLSSNPDKFLGNITTGNSEMDHDGFKFSDYWNQVTPENATKWQSVEGTRGVYNWSGADNAANYAKQHHFPFKFHTFIWGSQYPSWIKNLSLAERFDAIVKWMDAAKEHYPYLQVMDVANECMQGHQDDTYLFKDALGGGGKTGYDWLIKAFEMAGERWPDAILVYNDFNVLRWDNNNLYVPLVQALRDAGAPIDAYGCQAHHFTLNDIPKDELKDRLNTLQTALKMPMYITEYDINFDDDTDQAQRYKEQIPLFWEADYCAGITLWGWFVGATWADKTGLIRNRQERAALQWLREYMQTDAAKNAKSPYPGMKKEASIYIRPASQKVALNDVLPIKVRAKMATKTIEKVDLYVDDELIATMTEEPYIAEYTPSKSGNDKVVKAVVTTTDGTTYERYSQISVSRGTKRSTYNDVEAELPGTIKAEEFDKGLSGVTYNNASRSTTTATKDGAWMEYTVDVKEEGYYNLEVEVASTKTGGSFHLAEYSFDNLLFLTSFIDVPNTGSSTTFETVHCPIKEYLTAGRHVFTFLVDKGGFYIKSMTFKNSPTFSLPGFVEAEGFYQGGDGVSVVSGNGGYVITNTNNGAWLDYSIDVPQEDLYSYEATVSSNIDGSSFTMSLIKEDGTEKSLTTVTVPNTGSKDTYQVKTGKIRNKIPAGKQKLRITIKKGGCNIDNIKFVYTNPPSGIDNVVIDNDNVGDSYNLSGQKVGTGYKGIVIRNGKKIVIK